tara:strand:- start:178 stop:903 length:726 start_codon:yes stop_codon:yes gene_type:complete
MKKVAIIDDESSARKLISEYLEAYNDLIIIGEANNGVDAIQLINEFKPDLVFIDVQMPGFTGFEVLERIDELPIIIFSTAYDKYALKAFDVHATDYLLKPYTKQRFDVAISKINFDGVNKAAALAQDLMIQKQTYPDRLIVTKGKKYINLETSQILHVEAFGDYAKIHTESDSFLSNSGLGELEKRLDPNKFIRVHRSSIVYWPAVKEIDKQGKSFLLTLLDLTQVRVSRNKSEIIKTKMV